MADNVRSSRFQDGVYWDHTAAADITGGDVIEIGTIPTVADSDIASGVTGAVAAAGVYNMPLKATTAMSAGDAAYWDNNGTSTGDIANSTTLSGCITDTAADGNLAGVVVEDASSGDTYVKVALTAAMRTTAIAGSVTADDIEASDTSLTISGLDAATSGNGGTVVIDGGAGHTNGDGGLTSLTGGAAAGTGSAGAASLVGGASAGASGTAGAVNIDSGAAAGGTGAGITIGTTNATTVSLGISTAKTTASAPINYVAAGGTADVQTLTLAPAIDAYATGQMFFFRPVADNTGACTLNVNGKGAKNIKTSTGADPAAGDLQATTGISMVIYDGTSMILINPSSTCD